MESRAVVTNFLGGKENSTQVVEETPWEEETTPRRNKLQDDTQPGEKGIQRQENSAEESRRMEPQTEEDDIQVQLDRLGEKENLNNTPSGQIPLVEEELVFKDIEVSPGRNLSDSFEETLDSCSGKDEEESPIDEDPLNDLGLLEKPGIMEERSLEQTSTQKKKPNVGRKGKRGPKPI